MKKLVVLGVAVAALLLATARDAQASFFGHGGLCGGCAASPASCDCGPCAPAPCVTYQQVWKEKEETVTVMKRVAREEKYEYMVCTPVATAEKRKVTVCQTVVKEVEFKYIECVPVTKAEKRKVTQYTCESSVVECEVPCCTTVMVPCCDSCGVVSYTCQRVCTTQKVQRTVMKQVPHEVEVTVNVCTFDRVEKVGKRKVCEVVPVEQEVTVNVCKVVTEKKTGTRTAYDCVPTQEKRMVKYCEMVAVTTEAAPAAPVATVACCDTGCAQPSGCLTGCSSRCNLGGCFSGCGLFGGHGGGCGLFGGHGGGCGLLGGHGGGCGLFGGCR